MSTISLPKLQRVTAVAQKREAPALRDAPTSTVAAGVQDRSATENGTISPALFWKIIIALAMTSLACNAIGMAVFGVSWLTAYWDALTDWCAGGYCR